MVDGDSLINMEEAMKKFSSLVVAVSFVISIALIAVAAAGALDGMVGGIHFIQSEPEWGDVVVQAESDRVTLSEFRDLGIDVPVDPPEGYNLLDAHTWEINPADTPTQVRYTASWRGPGGNILHLDVFIVEHPLVESYAHYTDSLPEPLADTTCTGEIAYRQDVDMDLLQWRSGDMIYFLAGSDTDDLKSFAERFEYCGGTQ